MILRIHQRHDWPIVVCCTLTVIAHFWIFNQCRSGGENAVSGGRVALKDLPDDYAYFMEDENGVSIQERLRLWSVRLDLRSWKKLPKYSQYVFNQLCGGLGNQLYAFASTYALGKRLNRTPIFQRRDPCQRGLEEEVRDVFPNFHAVIYPFDVHDQKARKVTLKTCCAYETPAELFEPYPEKVLRIIGALQSYHYFDEHRREIKRLFRCSNAVQKQIRDYNQQLIRNAKDRRICVHTRRGDFTPTPMSSTVEYTAPAIDNIIQYEQEKYSARNFSVILLGIDKPFLRSIMEAKLNEKERQPRATPGDVRVDYYIPKDMSRTVDMCYGVHSCDTLLITTHGSTFSWWMAYLSPSTVDVYYNSNFAGSPYSLDNFLPNWKQLRL